MLVFIDESGIHKKDGKSSVVLVYVVMDNVENIERTILKTEKSLRITSFHWTRHIWKIRFDFIKALVKENFLVKTAIIDNPFSKVIFEEALKSLLTERKVKKIIMDGKKPRWYVL